MVSFISTRKDKLINKFPSQLISANLRVYIKKMVKTGQHIIQDIDKYTQKTKWMHKWAIK